jgi:hypothetical protein
MRRLNVRQAQIDECIQKSMFAIPYRPQNPELTPGEPLLLQLVKQEAIQLGKTQERINFALVFDHLERDYDGTLSRLHWPTEGRTWPWIVYCSATIPRVPFSLEDLYLTKDYQGQTNPTYIESADEDAVRPYIQWSLAEAPLPDLQLVIPALLPQTFGAQRTLSTIYNHDRIAALHPVPTRIVETERFERNPWLAESLKSYYDYRCQVCGIDFEPTYGVPVADTHHIEYLGRGGLDVSGNIVVVCPNHHRVIHATDARFNRQNLAYEYPNGLREGLILRDHFTNAPSFKNQASS